MTKSGALKIRCSQWTEYLFSYGIENEPFAFAVNNSRVSNKLIYRLRDDRVIESSMSDYTFGKFRKVLSSNRKRILKTLNEVQRYA